MTQRTPRIGLPYKEAIGAIVLLAIPTLILIGLATWVAVTML